VNLSWILLKSHRSLIFFFLFSFHRSASTCFDVFNDLLSGVLSPCSFSWPQSVLEDSLKALSFCDCSASLRLLSTMIFWPNFGLWTILQDLWRILLLCALVDSLSYVLLRIDLLSRLCKEAYVWSFHTMTKWEQEYVIGKTRKWEKRNSIEYWE